MADGRTRLTINPLVRLDGGEHILEQTTVVTDSKGAQQFLPYSGLLFRFERIDETGKRPTMRSGLPMIAPRL
jgi:hypothetical protein